MLALKSLLLEIIDALEIAHIHKDDYQFAAAADGARSRLSKLLSELDGWQPMYSAPLDGTQVDLWVIDGGGGRRWADCYWDRNLGAWLPGPTVRHGEAGTTRVTHWRAITGPTD